MRRRGKAIGTLAAATSLALVSGGTALADTVNVIHTGTGGVVSISPGGSVTVEYWIDATNNDGENGCNATGSSPATLGFANIPSEVTASLSSLRFPTGTTGQGCGINNKQSLSFTSSTAGNYTMSPAVSDIGNGTYATSGAGFTLRVEGPPVVGASPTNPSGARGSQLTTGGSFTDPNGNTTITTIAMAAADAGTLTRSGSSWSWSHTPTAAGSGTVTVTATDDTNRTATSSFTWTATAPQMADQTITFTQPVSPAEYRSSFNVNPTSSAALPVSVAGTGGCSVAPATPSGYTVTMTSGVTACELTATQAGSTSVNPADPVSRSVAASRKNVTGSLATANKAYDGTTAASGTRSVVGAVAGDVVSLTGTASFADKNVGTAKAVTVASPGLTGTDAGNYNLTGASASAADITVKNVTGGLTTANRVYDGTTAASGLRTVNGAISADDVELTGAASFADKNVGTAKAVTITSPGLQGEDASNYNLTGASASAADITVKNVTGSLATADKAYDGTTAASGTRSVVGAVAGDAVSLTGTASFADKNVGTAKSVTVASPGLTGTDAGNYNLTGASASAADITVKAITGSFTAADKTYDGTVAATINGRNLLGAVSGDTVSLTGGSANFDTAAPGDNKSVNGTGFSLAGTDASNYSLSSVANTTADIRYAATTFLQPINATGTKSSFKIGSTVPVKFKLEGASATLTEASTFLFGTKLGSTAGASGDLEAVNSNPASSGNTFRYDSTEGAYVYNWGTKNAQAGDYTITFDLGDGSAPRSVLVNLRR